MKTVYIATRFDRAPEVQALAAALRPLGYDFVDDWTQLKPAQPVSIENHVRAEAAACHDLAGAMGADLFVLLTDPAGTGMWVELGAALAHATAHGHPRIMTVGEHAHRSIFCFHPMVERVWSVDDLLRILAA
jgi:hypothetical protein